MQMNILRTRPGITTNGWPCFIVCNITWCLLLQLITLFRFSGRTADDQVMTKCIKFLTLGPMSTSTPSFQQLHACGILNLHLWSILIHFSPSKQASVFITDIDWRDHRPQCVILDSSRHALYSKTKMKINWCFTYLLTYLHTIKSVNILSSAIQPQLVPRQTCRFYRQYYWLLYRKNAFGLSELTLECSRADKPDLDVLKIKKEHHFLCHATQYRQRWMWDLAAGS